jgi:NADPH-dependent 2,4-dienoyl-CoA reductase/sulfur reductase-like enzyme
MAHHRYLIVGGGMAADAAARGIRELDPEGPVALLGEEPDPPYARPPLSKKLWAGKDPETVWRRTGDVPGVELLLGRRVTTLDLTAKRVRDAAGGEHGFDRLLLATGGRPRELPFADDGVIYFRTLADYRRLRGLAAPGRRVAVIGGGFIGSEIAAALVGQGCRVTLLFPDAGISSRIFPADLAGFLVGYYRDHGVEVLAGEQVTGVRRRGDEFEVETRSGQRLVVDAVVAGIGLEPNVELARDAGLAVDDGIVVDDRLRASPPDVFAAGDVARFAAPALGRRMRVEHEDNALTMGRAAGRAMAGDDTPYRHLPFFYSDLFDLGYEAVGELDARRETRADWAEMPFRRGIVAYVEDERIRGLLLWNVWDKVPAARALIGEAMPPTMAELRERLGAS